MTLKRFDLWFNQIVKRWMNESYYKNNETIVIFNLKEHRMHRYSVEKRRRNEDKRKMM